MSGDASAQSAQYHVGLVFCLPRKSIALENIEEPEIYHTPSLGVI